MSNVDPWIGQVLADRYRIHGAIGRGGMGTVYAATQEALGRDVAVKMIRTDLGHNAEAVERFKREAQVIARLTNPNIVVIHDFGSTDTGELYIVMEKIEGASLKEIAKQVGGPIAWNDVFSAILDTSAALKGAHAAGVIHRDLKPENIMVDTASGMAKVLDFGVAKLNDAAGQGALTGTGMIMGTPGYMAPEVVMGQTLDDPRSDLYSLGLTWLELLLGRPCFRAPTPSAILIQQINEGPPDLDVELPDNAMPAQVKGLLKSMLSRDLNQRPASADDVFQQLTALRAQIETGILPVVLASQVTQTESGVVSSPSLRSISVHGQTGAVFTNAPSPAPAPIVSGEAEVVGLSTAQFESLNPGETVTPVVQSGQTPAWNGATAPPQKSKLVPIAAGIAVTLLVVGGALAVAFSGDDKDPAGDMPKVAASDPEAATAAEEAKKAIAAARAEADAAKAALAKKTEEDAAKAEEEKAAKVAALAATKKSSRKGRRRTALKKAEKTEPVVDEPVGPPRLTSKLIKRGINKNLGKAKKCRNTNIKRREQGPGLLVDHCPSYKSSSTLQSIKLKLAPSGEVLDAHFASNGTNATDIGGCVLETVKEWKFPAFEDDGNGAKEISQRVEFEPCVPINNVCVF